MKYSPSRGLPPRGAAMLMVLIFAVVGGIAITSWMYLMGARLQQAEHQLDQVTRTIVWGNTSAINQQYTLGYAFRDNITQTACTALLNSASWGGNDQTALTGFAAFRVLNTASNPSLWLFPFNNLRNVQTSDNSYYYLQTSSDSDSSQSEHVTFYNYLMTYPTTLSGDLLHVHTKPSGAATGATICKNLLVSGRTVLYDSNANITAVKTTELLNQTKTGTNLALNAAGTNLMPANFPVTPRFTAGYGGAGTPNAVLDGSLNIINNANFTPGSMVDIMTNNGGYTNISAGTASGSTTTAVQVVLQSTPTYAPPVTSPYNYTYTSPFNVVTVRLVPPTTSGTTPVLGHLRINGSVDQLVLQGQTVAADFTAADALPPVVIWLEQEARDIRLVGENNRRLILVVGTGTGLTLYMGFSGTSILGGSNPLRWRLNLINQYRNIYLDQPSGKNVTLTGSIRTNWNINCTDATSTTRYTLQRETNPGTLTTLMPRDGWIAPCFSPQ